MRLPVCSQQEPELSEEKRDVCAPTLLVAVKFGKSSGHEDSAPNCQPVLYMLVIVVILGPQISQNAKLLGFF